MERMVPEITHLYIIYNVYEMNYNEALFSIDEVLLEKSYITVNKFIHVHWYLFILYWFVLSSHPTKQNNTLT